MPSAVPRSLLLRLYLALSARAGGLTRRGLDRRRVEGKEDGLRLAERMGQASVPRPDGQLVWFHAASVGEAASLLEMLRRLIQARPDLTCLVTTGTVTSAAFLTDRLPEGCIHQFSPLDVLPWVRRFLDHWRPDAAVFTESEMWPATLFEAHARGIPLLLINGRISNKSFRRWQMMGGMARSLLARYDRILAQDSLAGDQLAALGADPATLSVEGSLKEGAAPLSYDEAERAKMSRAFAGRHLWLAASTHPGEEEIVLGAYLRSRPALPFLSLLLVPRHPNRGDEVAALVRARGLSLAQRSRDEPVTADTDVYLADTLGEMGLWYRIAPVSFVGGSLVEVGGHNPFEPALLGSAILFGPHVRNFIDAYRRLERAGAAVLVHDETELAEAVIATLPPDRAAEMAAAAWAACSEGAEVTDAVLDAVGALIDRPRPAG